MKNFAVISDSSLDIDQKLVMDNEIAIVPYMVSFDSSEYKKDRLEIDVREFFEKVAEHPGVYPKTSMPSIGDYLKEMTKAAKNGQNIICICMSAKFTTSYQSARTAAEMVREDYPHIQIAVIDSTLATVMEGLFVLEACRLSQEGVPFEQAVEKLEAIKKTGNIFFTVGDLDYLIAGGRVGKAAGAIAQTMRLKPLIHMKDGELFPMGVARTRKGTWKKIVQELGEYIKSNSIDLNEQSITTGYGLDLEEGKAFNQYVKEYLKDSFGYEGQVANHQIGSALCVHTGPTPLGVALIHKAV
ncbi:MAG: DegV family protein [Ileibacterium sp.]|nr:DegV family protein [Ileibacterium sp.]